MSGLSNTQYFKVKTEPEIQVKEIKMLFLLQLLFVKLLLTMQQKADIIEPVSGHGKGRYKFKK